MRIQQLAFSEDEDDGDYSDNDSELSERDFDAERIAKVIKSSVDCLMELLPSIERTLEAVTDRQLRTLNTTSPSFP